MQRWKLRCKDKKLGINIKRLDFHEKDVIVKKKKKNWQMTIFKLKKIFENTLELQNYGKYIAI